MAYTIAVTRSCIYNLSLSQAALIRWTGEKPLKEYDFEYSSKRETVRRHKIKTDDSGVDLTSYSCEKDPEDLSEKIEPTSSYSPYTENGKE